MPISLPRHGHGGPAGRGGGRDGGKGRGGRGNPLPSCKRDATFVSNSRNTTLSASIYPLPCTPALGQAAAVPPPLAVNGPRYTNAIAALAHGSAPDPFSGPAPSSVRSTNAQGVAVPHDVLWWRSVRLHACIGQCAPTKKSPVKCACFLPDRTRLVTGSGNGRFESRTTPVGQQQCKNDQYRHRCAHLHP